ncbi:MAG: hypothetical protein ONB23_10315 [candidate division KSB1 bacterium]|nr:hypothetical protein [candidate division KSB1 bacterium]
MQRTRIWVLAWFCVAGTLRLAPAFATVRVTGPPRKIAGGEPELRLMRPVWSPDGSMLALTGENYRGLWVVGADGGGLRQLTDEFAAGYGMEWSLDSGAILARVAEFRGPIRYNAAKIFDLRTGETIQLTEYRTFMPELPHWADGIRRVAVAGRQNVEILDSRRQVASISKPIPHRFCYQSRGQMVIARDDGTPVATLDPFPGARYLNEVLSPDGEFLAFEVLGGDLYVARVDGKELVHLGCGHRPQWAPDSRHLVFMVTEDDGHRYLASDLFCVRADGSGRTAITETPQILEMNPSWSPDGRWIAFDVLEEGAIYLLPVEILDEGEGR